MPVHIVIYYAIYYCELEKIEFKSKMNLLNRLFPKTANNDYQGSAIAKWGLILFALLFTFRSLVHYFKEDGGANSIASFVTFAGTPDPDTLIYLLFSLWGGQQLVTLLIILVVLVRYQSLIPLMLLMVVIEQITRIGAGLLHPLTPDFYQHTPPGSAANLPILIITCVLFALSLWNRNSKKE